MLSGFRDHDGGKEVQPPFPFGATKAFKDGLDTDLALHAGARAGGGNCGILSIWQPPSEGISAAVLSPGRHCFGGPVPRWSSTHCHPGEVHEGFSGLRAWFGSAYCP